MLQLVIRASRSSRNLRKWRGRANLELDSLAVHLDGLDLEVNADGGDEGGREAVVGVAQ